MQENNVDDRKPVQEGELADAYAALKEIIPQMDYDAVEMILGDVKTYKLPDPDAEIFTKLEAMLKTFDWDGMEALLEEQRKGKEE